MNFRCLIKGELRLPFFIFMFFGSIVLHAQTLKQELNKGNMMLCAHRGGMYDSYAENSLRTLDHLEKSLSPAPVMAGSRREEEQGWYFVFIARQYA